MSSPSPGSLSQDLLTAVMEWDVFTWAGCLDYWRPQLSHRTDRPQRVLAIGERQGGLSLWFALQGYDVVCTDVFPPHASARQMHARFGVSDRITYAAVDALSLPFPDASFDVVTAKSVIGGLKLDRRDPSTRTLATQQRAIDEARRVLRPGGWYLGAENLIGSRLHQWGRLLKNGKRPRWRYLTPGEIDHLFQRYARTEYTTAGLIGTRWSRPWVNRLAAATDRLLTPLTPASTRYVGFIRAQR